MYVGYRPHLQADMLLFRALMVTYVYGHQHVILHHQVSAKSNNARRVNELSRFKVAAMVSHIYFWVHL